MSCTSSTTSGTVCTPCGFQGIPDPANEPLASALDNFVTSFYGSVTKSSVNGNVVWSLPCNLDEGLDSNPRAEGEGLACYFLRLLQEGTVTLSGGVLRLPNLLVEPAADVSVGQLYCYNGELKYISPGGLVTRVAHNV